MQTTSLSPLHVPSVGGIHAGRQGLGGILLVPPAWFVLAFLGMRAAGDNQEAGRDMSR